MKKPCVSPCQKPRLAVASRLFLPESGAAAFRLAGVVSAATKQGWHVDVLTTSLRGFRREVGRRVRILRFPVLRDRTGYVRGYLPYLSFDLPLALRLLTLRRPNLVLVEPPPTTGAVVRVICAIRRIPYVWYAPDIWSDATRSASSSPLIWRAVRFLESFAIRGAAAVIAVSEEFASRTKELGARTVHVALNGVDTGVYTPAAQGSPRLELGHLGIVKPYILYAGTASEWQKAEVFAEALVRDPSLSRSLQIVFIGNGTSWGRLRELREEAQRERDTDSLILLEPGPPETVAELLRGSLAAAVSLAPNLGYNQAYPTKVLTALATGTPVIYAGAGPATKDIRDNDFGLVVPLDEEPIREALRSVSRGTISWDAKKAEAASRWVREHRSLEAAGESAKAALEEVLRRGSCGGRLSESPHRDPSSGLARKASSLRFLRSILRE